MKSDEIDEICEMRAESSLFSLQFRSKNVGLSITFFKLCSIKFNMHRINRYVVCSMLAASNSQLSLTTSYILVGFQWFILLDLDETSAISVITCNLIIIYS